ncbi:MAG: uroporphyrinogen decarboxylase family protein [Alphaproteobacteria bacterium]|jgi:uroporphyrinogen decarboxylase|nr:uroporphyrinogen decarboxylase family protein [Alphaproteobacteria bacterium]
MRSMTGRERVLAALNHQESDRVPIDFGGCSAANIYFTAYDKLKAHLGLEHETVIGRRMTRTAVLDETVLQRFDVDTRVLALGAFEGTGHQREIDDDNYIDEMGAAWQKSGDGPYLNVDGPFYGGKPGVDDLDGFSWPDPGDAGYLRGLGERARALRENTDCAVVLNLPAGVVHIGQWLRGFDTWLTDLYRNRAFVCKLMDLSAEWWSRLAEGALDAAGEYVDVVNMSDDLGSQEATLLNPEIYRELIKPRHKRMVDAVKSNSDAKVLLHSCGAVSALLDDFIEVGFDAINPVQVGARGMEPERLKAEFGDRVTFWGGIDTQRILPFGTPDEVRAEVRRIIDILGPGGGFVLNSVHNIQAEVPPENVVAMFDEARSYRRH